MENQLTLAEHGKNISGKLLESIYLLEILDEIIDGEAKSGTVLSIIKKNICSAFTEIEDIRRMIHFPN